MKKIFLAVIIGILVLGFAAGFLTKGKITGDSVSLTNGNSQVIKMTVNYSGYSPNSFVLKKGIPVRWEINAEQLTGCNQEIIAKDYNIDKRLADGLNIIEFTPAKTGTFTFTCAMGMLKGSFIITEDGTATQSQIKASTPSAGSTCSMSSGGGCGCGGR